MDVSETKCIPWGKRGPSETTRQTRNGAASGLTPLSTHGLELHEKGRPGLAEMPALVYWSVSQSDISLDACPKRLIHSHDPAIEARCLEGGSKTLAKDRQH